MGQAPIEQLLAAFSPLSLPILLHLLLNRRRDLLVARHRSLGSITPVLNTTFERATGFAVKEWLNLAQDLRPIRQAVFLQVDEALRTGDLHSSWLSEALWASSPPRPARGSGERIAAQTLWEWRDQGLLNYIAHNSPDPHTASALLIARRLERKRQRHWLPGKHALDITTLPPPILSLLETPEARIGALQPWRLCWLQDAPASREASRPAPRISLLPLPTSLRRGTMAASVWPGVVWRDTLVAWLRVNSLGTAMWAGETGRAVTLEELEQWIPETRAFVVPDLEIAPEIFRALATLTLYRAGHDLLTHVAELRFLDRGVA
jgi:hypothetical protein